MDRSDIRKIAKEEFDKLKLPKNDPNTMLAWYFWKRAFDHAYRRIVAPPLEIDLSNDIFPKDRTTPQMLKNINVLPLNYQYADKDTYKDLENVPIQHHKSPEEILGFRVTVDPAMPADQITMVPNDPRFDDENMRFLDGIFRVMNELVVAHHINIGPHELMSTFGVTGNETSLEIWELSERIKKARNGKV